MKWYEDPIYIKMCDCEEIQKNRPFADKFYSELREGIIRHGDFVSFVDGESLIWLPRQDQLQEMVDWERLEQLLDPFISFYNRQPWAGKADGIPPSMNQLWLAFVMKEKYNKVWDGEQWIIKKK